MIGREPFTMPAGYDEWKTRSPDDDLWRDDYDHEERYDDRDEELERPEPTEEELAELQRLEAARLKVCPLCDAPLDAREIAGQFHHPHWNSLSIIPGLTVTESQIAAKIERAARIIAAEKCGVADKRGYRLPDDIWKQAIPAALAMLQLETLSEEDRQTILNAAAALESKPITRAARAPVEIDDEVPF